MYTDKGMSLDIVWLKLDYEQLCNCGNKKRINKTVIKKINKRYKTHPKPNQTNKGIFSFHLERALPRFSIDGSSEVINKIHYDYE